MFEAFNLSGRNVLVTGPAKGMGRSVTLTLAEAGANLMLLGRDLEPIEAVADEARRRGSEAVCCECDVTSAKMVDDAVASLVPSGRIPTKRVSVLG